MSTVNETPKMSKYCVICNHKEKNHSGWMVESVGGGWYHKFKPFSMKGVRAI